MPGRVRADLPFVEVEGGCLLCHFLHLTLNVYKRLKTQRLYDIAMDLLERAKEDNKKAEEAYGDAGERVTTLVEIANTFRNMPDSWATKPRAWLRTLQCAVPPRGRYSVL